MRNWLKINLISLTAIIAITGCGVDPKFLDQAQSKLDQLKTQGVPDSLLSSAKVYLYQAADAKKLGKTDLLRTSVDSLKKYLSAAEKFYSEKISTLLPSIESAKNQINSAKMDFSGLQVKQIDSMLAIADSFVNIKWYLQGYNICQEIIERLPQYKIDEEKSRSLKKTIPGDWLCVNETKGTENKAINATEKKIFSLGRDGKVKLIESKKGQSGPYLKEDWEFNSWGTWDMKGDTIHLFISRFAAVRQNFEKIYVEGKKKVWKKETQPTYDSLITDGSQDRYITYSDLKEDFKQIKKF